MPQVNYIEPPPTGNADFDRYMLEIHNRTFGVGAGTIGDLDNDNINGQLTDTIEHSLFTGVEKYQHHGNGDHDELDQGANVTDATASALEITSADADAVYSANEQTLINELKADYNLLIAEYNTFLGKLNSLLASLRAAKLIG